MLYSKSLHNICLPLPRITSAIINIMFVGLMNGWMYTHWKFILCIDEGQEIMALNFVIQLHF
jgi:hypothetical protein